MKFLFFRVLMVFLLASPVAAQETIFGPAPRTPFSAPERMFSVQLPSNWEPKYFPDQPDFVEFRVEGPGTAWLQVRRLPVPESARARQLLARAVEKRLSKLPHFAETSRRDVNFNGLMGASVLGTFWYQGNAQYPRAVEEVYLVVGREAFEFHFECFAPLAGQLSADLNRVYASFVPHPAPAPPGVGPSEDTDEDPLDKIPF
jgi:hypothetical protein